MVDTPWSGHERLSRVAPEYLHALGTISVLYNELEELLAGLLGFCVGGAPEASRLMHNRSTNRDRQDFILALSEVRAKSADERLAVRHFTSLFSRCAENRNIAMHARVWDWKGDVYLWKDGAAPKHNRSLYHVTVPRLREVADGMTVALDYGTSVFRHMYWHHSTDGWIVDDGSGTPPPLPERPPLPRKLSPSPPRADL